MHVRIVTQLAVESLLSAVGQDGISRALLAPYARPLASVIHAEVRAALIATPAASSRIGLLDFLVCGERGIAANLSVPTWCPVSALSGGIDLCGRSKAVKSGFIDTKLPGGRPRLWAFTRNQRRSTLPLMIW